MKNLGKCEHQLSHLIKLMTSLPNNSKESEYITTLIKLPISINAKSRLLIRNTIG